MRLRLQPVLEPDWPPLAWIACCDRANPVITVRHGPQVETREDWLCEAVWDGEFEAGDFDRTDLVFGSGIRLRDEGVVFVPAGVTVDRLQFLELGGTTWVSNSMACLLGVTGVNVDAKYDRYFDLFWSVTKGLDGYERRVPTLAGRLEIVFFRNLVWDGECLSEEAKPYRVRSSGVSLFGQVEGGSPTTERPSPTNSASNSPSSGERTGAVSLVRRSPTWPRMVRGRTSSSAPRANNCGGGCSFPGSTETGSGERKRPT